MRPSLRTDRSSFSIQPQQPPEWFVVPGRFATLRIAGHAPLGVEHSGWMQPHRRLGRL